MSVTDDIVKSIVELCEERNEKQFSHEIIVEDYLLSYEDELAEEIEEKLKAKGIEVGP